MDVRKFNAEAWDRLVEKGNRWTIPVSPEEVAAAPKSERPIILLTPTRPVPGDWLPPMPGLDVLCLASGGGQQGPILAAAGANVTVLDNSPAQLARDREVADRESLEIATFEGDMADLARFSDRSFDFIVHPVSNCFAPEIRPVWREAFRVLRDGGSLISGFCNPVIYLFDDEAWDRGEIVVRHSLPFSDLVDLTEEEREKRIKEKTPLEFGHTLEDQIGGQIEAGFVITGFYEDIMPDDIVSERTPVMIATRAVKPAESKS